MNVRTGPEEDPMESQAMFLNCPAYLDNDGGLRCGLPAEVEVRYIMNSTDGPLESAKIRCPLGHWFNGPVKCLTVPEPPSVAAVSARPLPPPAVPGVATRGPIGARKT
jgi:hypothetical protein